MKIQGVNITGGIRLDPPAAPTPSGPSKLVVGAPFNSPGSVYVYNTDVDGTSEQKITASDGASGDNFGSSVAMSDTHIVVGASGVDDAATDAGSAYIYNMDGTGEVKITASDGDVGDYFGEFVAINSTKIVVGSQYDDDTGSGSGSVYVYNTDGTGELKITASDTAADDNFGWSVAMSDTKIVVGAFGDNSRHGAAYVYNLDGTGEQKITASDGNAGDGFGRSVAIQGDKIVVGAWMDVNSGIKSGSVYVYNTDGTGEQKITASDGADDDRFGEKVAISDTHIVVGVAFDDDAGSNSGSAYVYNLDGTGEIKITASDAAAGDWFGRSVAISDTKVIVGASYNNTVGAVYMYNLDGTSEQKITASDGLDWSSFGNSVAIN